MAALTDILGNVQGTPVPERPTNTMPALSGALNAATAVFGILKDRKDSAWQDEVRDRTRQDWQYQDSQRAEAAQQATALDAAEQGFLAIRTGTVTPDDTTEAMISLVGDKPSSAPVPGDFIQAANDLARMRAAERQGKLPTGALQLQAERLITSLTQQYPDQAAELGQYFTARGFDHYLFREQNLNLAMSNTQDAAEVAAFKDDFEAAVNSGLQVPGETPEQTAAKGREVKRLAAERKAAKEVFDAQVAATNASQDQITFAQTQFDRTTIASVSAEVNMKVGPLIQQFGLAVQQFQNDPQGQKALEGYATQAIAAIGTYETSAIAALGPSASPALVEAIHKQTNNLRESLTALMSGPLSRVQSNQRALTMIGQQFGLKEADALKLYTGWSKILGRDMVNGIFPEGVQGMLPANVIKGIKDEMAGLTTADADEAQAHMARTAQLLAGIKGVHDYSEREARAQMPTLVRAAGTYQAAIVANGDRSPETFGRYAAAQAQLYNAMIGIQDGTTDLSSLALGTKAAANPGQRAAIAAMARDPDLKPQALVLANSSRIASARALEIARDMPVNDRYNTLKFVNGSWQIQFNEALYRQDLRQQPDGRTGLRPNVPGGVVPPEQEARKGKPDIVKKAEVLNANLTNLVELSSYRDDLPPGVTQRQLRDSYATGAPLRKANGEVVLTPDQLREQTLSNLGHSIGEFQIQTVTAPATRLRGGRSEALPIVYSAADQYGVPRGLAEWLIQQESGWDAHADNPTSTAYGWGQFIDETAVARGLLKKGPGGFDYRSDASRAIPEAMKYLRELYESNGRDWKKALRAYGVTAPSNGPGMAAVEAEALATLNPGG